MRSDTPRPPVGCIAPPPACPSATLYSTQEDPIGLAGGLNLYGYAGGDPINYSDPFGLCPVEKTGRPCIAVLAPGVRLNDAGMLGALDAIAAELNVTLNVYSGERTVAENKAVGGAANSSHLTGQAVDVIFEGKTKRETADMLFHSTARKKEGLRLLYHGPGAELPEHSHLDSKAGADIFEQKKGSKPRYVELKDPGDHSGTKTPQ